MNGREALKVAGVAAMHNVSLDSSVAFKIPLLSKSESLDLIHSCGELGKDPSSEHFTHRTKNIAYVLCINETWFQLRVNYFNQPHQYNDFSGGYKRYYQEMPSSFLNCKASIKVLNTLKSHFKIPDKEPILVQIQTSHIEADDGNLCLTGQGIHTDGHDMAMVLCLSRENIEGAYSSVYADLAGETTIIEPTIVDEGDAVFWKDNEVYHHVSPAKVLNPEAKGKRTVLIAHYPTTFTLTGKPNDNNTLTTNMVKENKRLRNTEANTDFRVM